MSQDSLASFCQALLKENMTPVNALILCKLANGPTSMTDVARVSGHTTAAATGYIDSLERQNLVTRIHDTEDRRKVLASITEKGRCKLANLRQAIR